MDGVQQVDLLARRALQARWATPATVIWRAVRVQRQHCSRTCEIRTARRLPRPAQ